MEPGDHESRIEGIETKIFEMDAFRTYMVRIAVAAENLFHEITKRFKMRIYDDDT